MYIKIFLDKFSFYIEQFNNNFNCIDVSLKIKLLRFRLLLRDCYIGENVNIYNKKYFDEDYYFNKHYVFNWL